MLRNLVLLRFLVGGISWLFPRLGGRLFGLDVAGNPQAPYLARLFGIRDIALGVGALQSSGDTQRQWLQIGLAGDVADTAAALLGRRDESLPLATTILVGGAAAAAAARGAAPPGEAGQGASSPASPRPARGRSSPTPSASRRRSPFPRSASRPPLVAATASSSTTRPSRSTSSRWMRTFSQTTSRR